MRVVDDEQRRDLVLDSGENDQPSANERAILCSATDPQKPAAARIKQ